MKSVLPSPVKSPGTHCWPMGAPGFGPVQSTLTQPVPVDSVTDQAPLPPTKHAMSVLPSPFMSADMHWLPIGDPGTLPFGQSDIDQPAPVDSCTTQVEPAPG